MSPATAHIAVEPVADARVLRLPLAGSRTGLHGVRRLDGDEARHAEIDSGSIRLEGPFPSQIVLRIDYVGEPPVFSAPRWDAEPAPIAGREVWRQFQERLNVATTHSHRLPHPEDYRFFTELEGMTNEAILCGAPGLEVDPCTGACDSVGAVPHLCAARDRWKQWISLRAQGLVPTPDGVDRRLALKISDLIAPVFLQHVTRSGTPDFDILWRTMSSFANGALRIDTLKLHLNAEPTSAQFFSFAEFALIALRSPIDPKHRELWRVAAPVFVGCQAIFMHVYRPRTDSLRFAHYSATNYCDPWDDDRIAALGEEYRRLLSHCDDELLRELEGRHTRHAQDAFPADLDATKESSGVVEDASPYVLMLSSRGDVLGRKRLNELLPSH